MEKIAYLIFMWTLNLMNGQVDIHPYPGLLVKCQTEAQIVNKEQNEVRKGCLMAPDRRTPAQRRGNERRH